MQGELVPRKITVKPDPIPLRPSTGWSLPPFQRIQNKRDPA
ncbi:hypothetical protein RISK_003253 [Rhodopirellula islandica]|uniref:Uncharacterized protein n=1 Tax=Rhodopirellula islandica TaxID=595434 RepID=A0A0J1BDP8_RHOIS|nr:hypothetical protein RISK_003253 [Rhodopirellula islandica]